MQDKDLKLLWARSAGLCAICKCKLTHDKKSKKESYISGEHAHIIGDKEGAARGKSILTPKERDSYHNRILLCSHCHTEIDKNEEDFPAEKLFMIKSQHEMELQENIGDLYHSKISVEKTIYDNLIVSVIELCHLLNWTAWTSWALGPIPQWRYDHIQNINQFREQVHRAIWPKSNPELEKAIQTISFTLGNAIDTFFEHSELNGTMVVAVQYYKIGKYDPVMYNKELDEFNKWISDCHRWIVEATKAVNWFADIVRRDIDPLFFVEKGKFLIEYGPCEDLMYYHAIPEYTAKEKIIVLQAVL